MGGSMHARSVSRKARPFLWGIGVVCGLFTLWFAFQGNYSMATNMAVTSTVVVGVPELLSGNRKKSDKPLPSAEAVGEHQKKNPTATLAESINDLRGE